MGGALLHNAFRPLDQYFVGPLGREAQGGLGAVVFVSIVAYGGALLLSGGAGPLVARATGAGDGQARREVVGAALTGATALGLTLAIGGLFGAERVVDLLGLDGPTHAHATAYLRVLLATGAAMTVAPTVDASFQSMGDTRTPMLLQALALALNATLTPALIHLAGWGVAGAALGTTLAQTTATGVGLALLWRAVGLDRRTLLADARRRLGAILSLGAPVAAGIASFAAVYWGLLATSISPLGPSVNAALGIGFGALESMTWPLFFGGMIASASLVGRRLGAGEPDEAWRAIHMMAGPVTLLGLGVGVLFYTVGPIAGGWLAADREVAREVALYAVILAVSQPFVAVEAFAEGVLNGSGHTRAVLWASLPLNALRIPLAWLLAIHLGWGAAGVWWAVAATSIGKALVKGALVWGGGWVRPPAAARPLSRRAGV
ncbi:MAG: MATE family efflux transporter [Deltaproteobacteria bacterium]|nr:MATE family efflux transporter [Deltaproteobacteria bacterium]